MFICQKNPSSLFQISGWDELRDRLNMYMEQYNESVRGSKMDLVYFKDAMINLVKVSIIISKFSDTKFLARY